MIEIEAEILRGSCTPVFFVGETIECEIKFKCVSNKNKILTKKKRQELEQEQEELKRKDSFLSDTQINSTKINEITESMFSILSTYPSQVSSPTSSLPGTPISEKNPFFRPTSSKSFASFLSDDLSIKESESDNNDSQYTIAWACAQIDCNCFIDESKVILPKDPLRFNINLDNKNEGPTTSFQPNRDRIGISVFSSKPKILFCNLNLRPNEVKSFIYKETLPYDLAPTFRGQFARYTYKLTIGCQKLNRTTQLLRLPFRVYSLLDFEKYIPKNGCFNDDNNYNNKKRDTIISLSDSIVSNADSFEFCEPPNPFKIEEKSGYENVEYALQILEDLTARINISHFNVANQDGKIVKITLSKTNFKIGDKIIAFLDFTEAQVPCVEFKVTLQSEEIISEECRKKPNQTLSIHSHVELKEYSLFMKKSDFTIQIPVNITPTFVSDLISLRWRLHFDFALSKTSIHKIQRSNDSAMSVSWRPPSSLQVEVTSWDLPIVIHPFDPFVASDLIYSNTNLVNDTNNLVLK